jgi:peptidyl-prolyl cis-trans isomerase B (cyclophilin B)
VNRRHWLSFATAASLVLSLTGVAAADGGGQSLSPAPHRAHHTGAATAASPCGFTTAVPADRFKGIPVFDAAKAAEPYSVRPRTNQGLITFQALTAKGLNSWSIG